MRRALFVVLTLIHGLPASAASVSLRPMRFTAHSGRVKPGEERLVCHRLKIGHPQTVEVGRVRMVMPPGGHHVDLYRPSASPPAWPPKNCPTTINFSDWELVAATQEHVFDWQLPPGVAINFSAHQPLLVQTHFLSAGAATRAGTAAARVELYPVDPASVTTHGGALFAEDRAIVVPPGRTTLTSRCMVTTQSGSPRDLTIMGFTGHYHFRGIAFIVNRVQPDGTLGEVLYQHDGLSVPPFRQYPSDQPLILHAGEGLEWRCTYQNNTHATFLFGSDTSRQEHCNLFGFYYPTASPQEAIACVHEPGDEPAAGD